MSEINTTPLVDIMLVLLIIFLITIPVITKNVPVHVPKAVNIPTQTKPENITISVSADGDVYWAQQHVPDMKRLVEQVEREAVKVPQPEIHIRADAEYRLQERRQGDRGDQPRRGHQGRVHHRTRSRRARPALSAESNAMSMSVGSSEGGVMCDINTTPLIDVMLVLLVTLILSLPIMTHAVKLDMPPPNPNQPPPQTQPEIINLDIYYDGTISWNGGTIPNLDRAGAAVPGGGGQGSAAGAASGARQSCEVRRGGQGAGGGAA